MVCKLRTNLRKFKLNQYDVRDVRNKRSIPWSGRSLEKEMVTHSSILAWRTPWTKEPGWLQSRGLRRVGHN